MRSTIFHLFLLLGMWAAGAQGQDRSVPGKEFDRGALDQKLRATEITVASAGSNESLSYQSSAPQPPVMQTVQPAPEMQSLARALVGRWLISEKYEPDEWTPNGGVGRGEEVWRSGPGGFTLMEEYHSQTPSGETFGLALTWWDSAKGFQGTWCTHTNPKGCDIHPGAPGPKWDGQQLVIDTEFPRAGKKFLWHEVFSDITPNSFTQVADIGESGGPMKRWVTIRGTRVIDASLERKETASTETELHAMMDECRKASLEGDMGKIASCLADEYRQTDISGYVQDKTTWLDEYFKPLAELIKAGKFRWEIYERKDVKFQTYSDCVVVIGALEAKGTGAKYVPKQHTWVADTNASFSGTLRFTHIYVKRDGKWLLAALHNQLPPPPASN